MVFFFQFSSSGLSTRLVIYSHNWDDLEYAREILSDPSALAAVSGVAFHCYAGDHAAPAQLANEFPGVQMLFEECTG